MSFAGPLRPLLHTRCVLPTLLLLIIGPSRAAEWNQYRGANHDGIATSRIVKQWSGSVTNPVWRVPAVNALCSLSVSDGRVFTQVRRSVSGTSREVCVALNANSGAELWATPVDIASYPDGGVGTDDGPRTTPAAENGSVYVLSSRLKLFRLNATNGAVVWQKDLVALFGGVVIAWQNAASPVLENGLIYLNASCETDSLMALRTEDGEVAWRTENEALTHSSPVLATIQGQRQVIYATQSGLVSLDPLTGERFWKANYPFNYGSSVGVSPVVYRDLVFICGAHSYGMGSVVYRIAHTNSQWQATQLWFLTNPSSHWMTPVVHEGFLYGQFGIQQFDSANAQLKCIDMLTGRVLWSTNGFGRGATVLVDNHLVTVTERGELVLSRPSTNAYTPLARFLAIPNYHGTTNKCWNAPAIAAGRVYLRSTAMAAAFDFSTPELRIDPPVALGGHEYQLTVRLANGAPLTSGLVTGLQVRASATLDLPFASWLPLTNQLVLTNNAAQIQFNDLGPHRFFQLGGAE